MRYKPEHKEATYANILRKSGETFRLNGFDGVGVDGLAGAAGVTSGAFYKHFRSKAEAFREVVRAGVQRVVNRVLNIQEGSQPGGTEWIDDFISVYMSRAHRDATAQGCALPTLTVDVGRASAETQAIYQAGILEAAKLMAGRPPFVDADNGQDLALAVLALLAGGTSISRAFADPDEADRVAEAVRRAASHLAHTGFSGAHANTGAIWRAA